MCSFSSVFVSALAVVFVAAVVLLLVMVSTTAGCHCLLSLLLYLFFVSCFCCFSLLLVLPCSVIMLLCFAVFICAFSSTTVDFHRSDGYYINTNTEAL